MIVSEGLLDLAASAPASHHDSEDERGYVERYLTKDFDGRYYVDYVSWESVVGTIGGDNEGYGAYLEQVASLLSTGLNSSNEDVRQKYLWLYQKYLSAVNTIDTMPQDAPWALENWEQYAGIKALPRCF